jgi:hypothetical protein
MKEFKLLFFQNGNMVYIYNKSASVNVMKKRQKRLVPFSELMKFH